MILRDAALCIWASFNWIVNLLRALSALLFKGDLTDSETQLQFRLSDVLVGRDRSKRRRYGSREWQCVI